MKLIRCWSVLFFASLLSLFSVEAYGQCPCTIVTNPYRMVGGRQYMIIYDTSIPEFSTFRGNLDWAIAGWQAVEAWNSQLPQITNTFASPRSDRAPGPLFPFTSGPLVRVRRRELQ
jgi:hypothetical protein